MYNCNLCPISELCADSGRTDIPEYVCHKRWQTHGFNINRIITEKLKVGKNSEAVNSKPEPVNMVNHPAHYNQGKIECIDAMAAATKDLTGIEAVCISNAIRYLWRWKRKGGYEDLRKAKWYIERLLQEETK